jgi:signal transduction histidine kinase
LVSARGRRDPRSDDVTTAEVAASTPSFEAAFDAERAETIRTRSRWIWGASIPVWVVSLAFVDRSVFTAAQALTVRVPECLLAVLFLLWLRKPTSLRRLEAATVFAWTLIAAVSSYGFLVMPLEKLPAKVASLMLSVLLVALLGSFTWGATLAVAVITMIPLGSVLYVGATSLFQVTLTVVGFAWGVLVVSAAARDRLKRAELLARRGLVEANEKLQREDELKRRLFVNLSHDLRTPLAVVRGEAAMLRKAGRMSDDDAALWRVERNADALAQLADQLLDLARLEAGQMPVRPLACDVASLARDVATQLAPPGPTRIVTEITSERAVARVDPAHVSRIVTNLTANALRQTRRRDDQPGLVTLAVRTVEDRVELDVIDEGPGVPPERREAIFTRFVSFDADGNTASGIGLPLARELALVNAGTLVLLDDPAGGRTTFRLTLPATAEPAAPLPVSAPLAALARRPPAAPASGQDAPLAPDAALALPAGLRRRVLVVEDNADMGALLVRSLGAAYRVEHVTRVADALAVLSNDPPTAVLSDVMLPDGTGYDVLAAVRSRRELDRMPVVLVSALSDIEQRVRGLAAGADDYIPKPFAPEELRGRVAAAVERAETWSRALAAQRDALLMEVHDGVSASLSRASMLLSELGGTQEPHLSLEPALDAIRDGLDEVRAITRLLAPKPTTFLALTSEIRRAMADACAAAKLELDFRVDAGEHGGDETVPAATAHTLRRVAREATTNAIKHANATRLVCRVATEGASFTLRVEDDGRGLPDARGGGQGLGIMARRVARVGGTVELGNRPAADGRGTRVDARLPRIDGAR